MSQGGKVEKSGAFPSPQVQTETEPSAHSGAERLWMELAKERRSRGVKNISKNLYWERWGATDLELEGF